VEVNKTEEIADDTPEDVDVNKNPDESGVDKTTGGGEAAQTPTAKAAPAKAAPKAAAKMEESSSDEDSSDDEEAKPAAKEPAAKPADDKKHAPKAAMPTAKAAKKVESSDSGNSDSDDELAPKTAPAEPMNDDEPSIVVKSKKNQHKTVDTKSLIVVATAGKESKIPVKSLPPAKTAKSKVEKVKKPTVKSSKNTKSPLNKKAAKSPEASQPVKYKPEKPNDALPHLMKTVGGSEDDKTVIEKLEVENTKLKAKVKEVEFFQSTLQARLTEMKTESSAVVTDEPLEPAVSAEAAPPMEATSVAPEEPAAPTPVAVEEAPTTAAVIEDTPTPADCRRYSSH
jgi:nucleolin